jgi:hypothetical protein
MVNQLDEWKTPKARQEAHLSQLSLKKKLEDALCSPKERNEGRKEGRKERILPK